MLTLNLVTDYLFFFNFVIMNLQNEKKRKGRAARLRDKNKKKID